MTTATVADQSGGKVRALVLDGVQADEASVISGRYKLKREVFLIAGTRPAPAVAKFRDFARSAGGAAVIRANGAIPALCP